MGYYIGIDGGGTKTMFAIMDEEGKMLGTHLLGTADHKQIGAEGVVQLLKDGIEEICKYAEGENTEVLCSCFGMPCYGESPENDTKITAMIAEQLPQYHINVINDCEVGWAASLLLEPGINMVAGTGSIAFGKNAKGETGRSGGWSEWFSDEGSGRWLGMKCIQIFSKESDGRLERGALHGLIRAHFGISVDEEVIDIFEAEYLPSRSKLASLQRILLEAAKQGDQAAIAAYEEAVEELYQITIAVYNKLFHGDTCTISYSGGIFNIEEFVKIPFCKRIEAAGIKLTTPQTAPHIGAAIWAYDKVNGCRPQVTNI